MGTLFRSEEMALCQVFLQREAAYNCVSELGEVGLVQFTDLNPDVNEFQRKYVSEVRRCHEMERKLRYLESEIQKESINVTDTGEDPAAPQPREMTDLEVTFESLETDLKEINRNAVALKKNYLELTELKHVLKKADVFFAEKEGSPSASMTTVLIKDTSQGAASTAQLGFVAGVVTRERIAPFERMLWRACKGNVFLRQAEIEVSLEDPATGAEMFKSVFVIFFQGDRLKTKVKKICEGFRATLYPCPEARADRAEIVLGVTKRIEDLNIILAQTQEHKYRVLELAAKNIINWFIKVRKIKAIYHTLNLFNVDVTQKCLIAECWVPILDIETIRLALYRGSERSGSSVPPILNKVKTSHEPPTFNRVNKFTSGFQNLVNAYGVASYRETNPAPYTIITFPFLFAVMFGDVGHGLIMTLFGAYLVIREKKLQSKKGGDIWTMFFGGRYIILLMGLFSVYTGFIYNDIFSKSLNIFGSQWHTNYNKSTLHENDYLTLDPATADYSGSPYPFGSDPIWQLAENKINVQNGYKMRVSIILGVIHMTFGVVLSLRNYIHFRNWLDIFASFIPQILFLLFLFMYLVVLVFIKWIIYSPKSTDLQHQPYCAPFILIIFINMVLLKQNEGNLNCNPYMYPGQDMVQKTLLAIAVACIPCMLLIKPVVLTMRRKKETKGTVSNHVSDAETGGKAHHEEEEEPLSEIYIHQAIHTVEYVLGSVSHTASYLRLWALSLAHGQLSDVLWKMVLGKALAMNGYVGAIALFVIFAFWAVLTIAILVLMEGLSAFLHTLRLHWVEFQSKFYDGKGYDFQPFSFKIALARAAAEEE